jgi:hypothetical protein
MASNPIPTCPKCKQADQVQKVSNVYDANTEEWSEEKLGMDVFGHIEDQKVQHEAHTKLGLKLKPPEEPTPPRSPALWYIIGIIIAVIILAGLCPFAVAPFAIVIPIVMANSETLPAAFQGQNGRMLMVGIGAAVLIGGLVVLGLLVWAGFAVKRRYGRDMVNYRDKKEAFERDELQPFKRAEERWKQLYFCMRDMVVFIPEEKKAIPMEDMGKYIRDAYYKF